MHNIQWKKILLTKIKLTLLEPLWIFLYLVFFESQKGGLKVGMILNLRNYFDIQFFVEKNVHISEFL